MMGDIQQQIIKKLDETGEVSHEYIMGLYGERVVGRNRTPKLTLKTMATVKKFITMELMEVKAGQYPISYVKKK